MTEEEETTMEVEQTSKNPETGETINDITKIINHLINCDNVYFKSQQRGENEFSANEKRDIATKVFEQSKSGFLCRFGKHLKQEHLVYFEQFATDETDGYAINYYVTELNRFFTKSKREKDIKNRRYDALKKLQTETSYFTETEMMRRNPLLYDQLVGQYLSEDEKKQRDNIDTANITFVNLLLESIDRDTLRKKQKEQQEDEACEMEEDDNKLSQCDAEDSWDDEEEPIDKTTKWGEFPGSSMDSSEQQPRRFDRLFTDNKPKDVILITATERRLLKEEFVSVMYQSFLDGNDVDFDYASVDDNEAYDNLVLKTHDAEDSYFDSETPEDVAVSGNVSEDELDLFMDRLSKNQAVQQLSEQLNKL